MSESVWFFPFYKIHRFMSDNIAPYLLAFAVFISTPQPCQVFNVSLIDD